MSLIRKYFNHTLQTNPRHCEEELHNINSHKAPGKQLKQSNQLSLPRQDDCKTRKDTKVSHKKLKNPQTIVVHKTMNQQQQNRSLKTDEHETKVLHFYIIIEARFGNKYMVHNFLTITCKCLTYRLYLFYL